MNSHPTADRVDAVIFDIGNVLLKFDYLVAARKLAELAGRTELAAHRPVAAAKAELESGAINRAEFLRRVRPEFGHTGSEEDFLRAWRDIFEENAPMTAFAAELASRGVPTFLLSNISCIHVDHILATYPVFATFRDAVYSFRAKALKPAPKIYEVAIAQFAIDPSRALFIDDLAENVEAARASGLQALQYDWREHEKTEPLIRQRLKFS